MNPSTSTNPAAGSGRPWWKYKMMWLVVGGPLVVVAASFLTLGLAISHPDPVIETSSRVGADDASMSPAMQARNHAATGGATTGDAK